MNRFYRIILDPYPGLIRAEGTFVVPGNSKKEVITKINTLFPLLSDVAKFVEEIKFSKQVLFDITIYRLGYPAFRIKYHRKNINITFKGKEWKLDFDNPMFVDNDINTISRETCIKQEKLKKFFEGFMEWRDIMLNFLD